MIILPFFSEAEWAMRIRTPINDLPILLAGGGFQHGSFKKLPAKGHGKVPLCNLYVSILQQFGLERGKLWQQHRNLGLAGIQPRH